MNKTKMCNNSLGILCVKTIYKVRDLQPFQTVNGFNRFVHAEDLDLDQAPSPGHI